MIVEAKEKLRALNDELVFHEVYRRVFVVPVVSEPDNLTDCISYVSYINTLIVPPPPLPSPPLP